MNSQDFINKLLDIVNNYKTIYAYGTWGQVLNNSIIYQKKAQYPWWYDDGNVDALRSLVGQGYFVFDCVGMIKGVLWGWCGNYNNSNGGATYQSNGVPDLSANGMFDKCYDKSTDFSNIEPGEALWMDGHIGIYYGDGKAIECSTYGRDNVQITEVNGRGWTKHGKLPYINYGGSSGFLPARGWFQPGDSGANVEKLDAWLATQVQGDYYGIYTTEAVKALQMKGKQDGVYNDEIDGCFGELTLKAAEYYGFRP